MVLTQIIQLCKDYSILFADYINVIGNEMSA